MSSFVRALRRSSPQSESKADIESSADNDPRSAPPLAIPCHVQNRLRKKFVPKRTSLLPNKKIGISGWPSRGGRIVLDAEDAFCRELLRLGATWWDSDERYHFVMALARLDPDAMDAIDTGEKPLPTRRERKWVRVAWPADAPGSVCVAEYDSPLVGFQLEKVKKMVPDDAGRVALARNMDERCDVLKRLGGTLYASLDDYHGEGFLKAWEEGKHEGEVGPLIRTVS